MSQDLRKQQAAAAALEHVREGTIIGVGTGSTVNFFIDGLAAGPIRIAGAVSSSDASTRRLEAHGIPVLDLNATGDLELYVDGADEATRSLHLIKGGGAALTREKIVAAASRRFVCIVDDLKLVDRLGRFPLPVEVIPMARAYVARQIARLGGEPVWRETDGHRQRQPHPRRPRPRHRRPGRARIRVEPGPGHRDGRPVRDPAGGPAAGRDGIRGCNVDAWQLIPPSSAN